jgi:hypothetical protein
MNMPSDPIGFVICLVVVISFSGFVVWLVVNFIRGSEPHTVYKCPKCRVAWRTDAKFCYRCGEAHYGLIYRTGMGWIPIEVAARIPLVVSSYPTGTTVDANGITRSNKDVAEELLRQVKSGKSVAVPNILNIRDVDYDDYGWRISGIDPPNSDSVG